MLILAEKKKHKLKNMFWIKCIWSVNESDCFGIFGNQYYHIGQLFANLATFQGLLYKFFLQKAKNHFYVQPFKICLKPSQKIFSGNFLL